MPPLVAESEIAEPHFQCQGKVYCSQMTSSEEAEFYLDNCPGTKMDGDRDGIPCENQF
ncbi:excalibur calcium-binding domain-containing protein [Methylosarcina fibrata]|uniref:excalibur calcium-binding domain-containing protein n=1 Tax=Methylosarcina fibrata TaxID=105972 RepID=UPI002FC283E6